MWKDVLSSSLTANDVPATFGSGARGLTKLTEMYIAAFPDLKVTIDRMIAEKDLVNVSYTVKGTHDDTYMGIPATHKKIRFNGTSTFRFDAQGKIAERWSCIDQIPILNQLGVSVDQLIAEPVFA
jgi:steroid delta-isomerase-like uncharacterized protein